MEQATDQMCTALGSIDDARQAQEVAQAEPTPMLRGSPVKSLQCLVVYTFFTAVTLASLVTAVIPLAYSGEGLTLVVCIAPLFAVTAWAAFKSYREVSSLLLTSIAH